MAQNTGDAISAASRATPAVTVPLHTEEAVTKTSAIDDKYRSLRKRARKPRLGHNADLEKLQVNWECGLKKCLPTDLLPRALNKNGTRVGIHEPDKPRMQPLQWSKRLVQALSVLSLQTVIDRDYAVNLLLEQVAKRQEERNHSEWYAREVLVSDVNKVTADVGRRTRKGIYKTKGRDYSRLEVKDMDFGGERDLAGDGESAWEGNAMQEWMGARSERWEMDRQETATSDVNRVMGEGGDTT